MRQYRGTSQPARGGSEALRERSWQPYLLTPTKPQPHGVLVKALARAWRWQKLLDRGDYSSVTEIAEAEKISKSYVSRILRLALLAPDIVEAMRVGGSAGDAGAAGAAAAGGVGRRKGGILLLSHQPARWPVSKGACSLGARNGSGPRMWHAAQWLRRGSHHGGKIRRPPEWVPDLPPPRPEARAARP